MTTWAFIAFAALASDLAHASDIADLDGSAIAYRVPIICSSFARIEADRYPEVWQTFDDWDGLKDFELAERVLHGQDWWRRSQYARLIAQRALKEVTGRTPTSWQLANALFLWKQRLQDYSPAMKEALGQNCQRLFEDADRWADQHRAPFTGEHQ